MEIIDALMRVEDYKNDRDSGGKNVVTNDDGSAGHISSVTAAKANGMDKSAVENHELNQEVEHYGKIDSKGKKKIYAGKRISKDDLIDIHAGGERNYLSNEIAQAYDESKEAFKRDENFRVDDQFRLLSREGTLFIDVPKPEDLEKMRELAQKEDNRVYSEGDEAMREERLHAASRYVVEPAFIKFLAGEETWDYICEGAFDEAMARVMQDKEDE